MTPVNWSPAQRAAIETEGRDLLVTAGAGTGKTTVLVERILYKLRQKTASLEDLLVVTFTDKAAQEMKDRLAEKLALDPHLSHHLPRLPRAAISTIHSFCARLLREHFLEAEIEPGFRILDENAQVEAMQEAMRRTFHHWYALGDTAEGKVFQRLVELTGFDDGGEILRRILRRLHEFSRVTRDPEAYLEGLASRAPATVPEDLPWYATQLRQLLEAWGRALRLYDRALSLAEAEGKKTAAHRDLYRVLEDFSPQRMSQASERAALVDQIRRIGKAGKTNEHGIRTSGLTIDFPTAPRGAAAIAGFKVYYEAAKKAFEVPVVRALPWPEDRLRQEDEEQQQTLRVLVSLVREMDGYYQAYKNRRGALDFADLEVYTVRLLQRHGQALDLAGRYREVLVDEFQDVNELQDYILAHLSPEDGRFRVGDVKQSIYQFRLADPRIFLGLASGRTTMARPDDVSDPETRLVVYLSDNHRSRPVVLRLVNHIFAQLFREEDLGSAYAEQALQAARPPANDEAPIELHLLKKGPDLDPTHTRLEHQARFTAQRIARLIREENPRIPDGEGNERPASWRDVAILLRSRTRAQVILEALQAEGVPAILSQGGTLWDEEAVRDFLSLLQVVDNPRDDIALAAVLRSPVFCTSDSELLRLRLAWPKARALLDAVAAAAYEDDPAAERGAFWPPAVPSQSVPTVPEAWTGPKAAEADQLAGLELRRRMRRILDKIRQWRALETRLELSRFLVHLLEEVRFASVLRARGQVGRDMAGLEKLLSLARDYEAERGPSLHGFLSRVADLAGAGETYAVPRCSQDEDAVTILSVHKAKGLEFPIVVLPQLEWAPPQDRLGHNIRIGEKWVGLRRMDPDTWARFDTSPRWVLETEQGRARSAEEARVLYVALTRARERLILIGMSNKSPWEEEDLPADARREQLYNATTAIDQILSALPWDRAQQSGGGDETRRCAGGDRRPQLDQEDAELPSAAKPPGEAPRPSLRPLEFTFPEFPLVARVHLLSEITWPDAASEASGEANLVPGNSAAIPSVTPAIVPGNIHANVVANAPTNILADLRAGRPLAIPSETAEAASREVDALLARAGLPAPHAPFASIESLKGKYWVTEFKQAADRGRAEALAEDGAAVWRVHPADAEDAAAEGTRYHAALARLDLRDVTPESLDRQMACFAQAPWWAGAPRDVRLEAGLSACLRTPQIAQLSDLARAGAEIHRECSFTHKWPVRELARLLPALQTAFESDSRWQDGSWAGALDLAWVLLQGRIDCIYRTAEGWMILDWKTDRVNATQASVRAEDYRLQMRLYREAASRLWGAPIRTLLAFVRAGVVVEIDPG